MLMRYITFIFDMLVFSGQFTVCMVRKGEVCGPQGQANSFSLVV